MSQKKKNFMNQGAPVAWASPGGELVLVVEDARPGLVCVLDVVVLAPQVAQLGDRRVRRRLVGEVPVRGPAVPA